MLPTSRDDFVNLEIIKIMSHDINFYFDNSKYFIHNCIFFNIIVTA